jgi:hypothetical protein
MRPPSMYANLSCRPLPLRPPATAARPHRIGLRLVMILLSCRAGRPQLDSPRIDERIGRLLVQPKAWTIPRLYQRLGCPTLSLRTLGRRVRKVACRRRRRLVAKGDSDRDQVLAELRQQITEPPPGAVLLAADQTSQQPAGLGAGPPGCCEVPASRS